MIDLTPLDVRKKRGDFRKGLRGYEAQEVDSFLDLVAERLEELVRENMQLRERTHSLQQQTESQTQREEAVRDALVTAQELRTEIREQARTEADRIIHEAQTEARRLLAEAEAEVRTRLRNSERQADHAVATLGVLERRRLRFLQTYRQLLEREMDVVEVEEGRPPLEERSFDLDFGGAVASTGGTQAVGKAAVSGTGDRRAPDGWASGPAADAAAGPDASGSHGRSAHGAHAGGTVADAAGEESVPTDPRLDQSLDELYGAALDAVESDAGDEGGGVAGHDGRLDTTTPPPRRNENLLLYPDPEDPAEE